MIRSCASGSICMHCCLALSLCPSGTRRSFMALPKQKRVTQHIMPRWMPHVQSNQAPPDDLCQHLRKLHLTQVVEAAPTPRPETRVIPFWAPAWERGISLVSCTSRQQHSCLVPPLQTVGQLPIGDLQLTRSGFFAAKSWPPVTPPL